MRLKTAEVLALTWRFYRRYVYSWEVNIGFIAALVAFILRAVASGSLMPLALTNLVNSLENSTNGSLSIRESGIMNAILMITATAVIYTATEWLFKPFWNSVAKSIADVKNRVISEMGVSNNLSNVNDLVGRLASDVDFVMWNIGGMYTTFTPNILTTIVSLVTIFQLSPVLGIVAVAATPLSLLIMEPYIKGVEEARQVERSSYSEVIHLIDEYFKGNAEPGQIRDALNKWYRGMTRQVFYDRTYWSSSFAYSLAMPVILTILGIHETERGRLPIGNLVGIIYASMNVYSPLINALWGICVLGQSLVPMNRIMQLSSNNGKSGRQLAEQAIH
ncbi:MAG: ABC transporter transmembrane domain-containing protein [Caldivirga sp.]|jgi:ABC-type multidrug transport system fused ATPase/permease subunit